ncbi:MAG: hypothetical protein ACYS0C_01790 [Planctomycetota bacterium]|jgi:hypothetical protein
MISAKLGERMGRYYWDKKDTVEECRSVSISFLKNGDYFCGYRSGGIVWKNCYGEETSSIGISVSTMDGDNYVRFQYTTTGRHTDEKTEYDYKVSLTTTPCNFGGVRYWFICPLYLNGVYCGRRVGTLYLAPGGNYFGCRHCYNLSYESRNESRLGRFGQLGCLLKTKRQIKDLSSQIKRSFYNGKPTRKFRKLLIMQNKLNAYLDSPAVRSLLCK